MLRKILPRPVKAFGRKTIKFVRYNYRRLSIMLPVLQRQPIKIILGAAETSQPGWYPSNESWLDITSQTDWQAVFGGQALLTHAVAEHVFEHLTVQEAEQALRHIYAHLGPGGRLRIAVPDGYNPNPDYLRHVGIGGIGDDAADHKQLLNVDVLQDLMQRAGFKTTQLEGYRADGTLVQNAYDDADGFIKRSRKHAGDQSPWSFPDAETSLIVDGVKA